MSGLLWWLLTRVLRQRPARSPDGYVYGPERTLPLSRPLTVSIEFVGIERLREQLAEMGEKMRDYAEHAQWFAGHEELTAGRQLDPHTCRDLALDLWEIEQLPEVEE